MLCRFILLTTVDCQKSALCIKKHLTTKFQSECLTKPEIT